MPSPFPGMDPYLEISGLWQDFHQSFIIYWRDQLVDRLPDDYDVRVEERVNLIEARPAEEHHKPVRPDLTVLHRGPRLTPSGAGGVATLEPVSLPLVIEPEEVRESRIHILHRPDHTLVTVLELLLPTNKSDVGRSDYLAKRRALLRQKVHLVEVDLLIGGQRLETSSLLPPGDYCAMVARSDRRPNIDVYTWTARDPLPVIPIPLKAPDPDIPSDLAAVFNQAYERGRYARSIDYNKPLDLPLIAPR